MVRNFWMEATIEGRASKPAGGPRSKTGDMVVTVYQREEGKSVKAVQVHCQSLGDALRTRVYIAGELVGEYTTER